MKKGTPSFGDMIANVQGILLGSICFTILSVAVNFLKPLMNL